MRYWIAGAALGLLSWFLLSGSFDQMSQQKDRSLPAGEWLNSASTRPNNRSEEKVSFPHDRLAKLYSRYPVLAFDYDPFAASGGQAFEEVLMLFEDHSVPRELNRMWSRDEWDIERAQQYLDKNKDLIQALNSLRQLPPERRRLPENLFGSFDRLAEAANARRFLSFKRRHHLESGDSVALAETNEALLSLAEHWATRSPLLVSALVAASIESSVYKELSDFEVFPKISPRLSMDSVTADAFRGDFLYTMSAIEEIHEEGAESKERFEQMGVSEKFQRFLLEEPRDQVEEAVAEYYSVLVHGMDRSANAGQIIPYHAVREKIHEILQRFDFRDQSVIEEAWALMAKEVEAPYRQSLHHLHYQATRAVRLAHDDGVEVSQLGDLVPDYLFQVPVNPATQEKFTYDPSTVEVVVPTDLRDWDVQKRRYIGLAEALEEWGLSSE